VVAQVQEQELPVIPLAVNPAGEPRRLAGIDEAQRAQVWVR